MVCQICIYFNKKRFYCTKLCCHVYLTDKCKYFKARKLDTKQEIT